MQFYISPATVYYVNNFCLGTQVNANSNNIDTLLSIYHFSRFKYFIKMDLNKSIFIAKKQLFFICFIHLILLNARKIIRPIRWRVQKERVIRLQLIIFLSTSFWNGLTNGIYLQFYCNSRHQIANSKTLFYLKSYY